MRFFYFVLKKLGNDRSMVSRGWWRRLAYVRAAQLESPTLFCTAAPPAIPPIPSAIHRIRIRSWTGKKGSLLHPRSNILLSLSLSLPLPFRPPDLLQQPDVYWSAAPFPRSQSRTTRHPRTGYLRHKHCFCRVINMKAIRTRGDVK